MQHTDREMAERDAIEDPEYYAMACEPWDESSFFFDSAELLEDDGLEMPMHHRDMGFPAERDILFGEHEEEYQHAYDQAVMEYLELDNINVSD